MNSSIISKIRLSEKFEDDTDWSVQKKFAVFVLTHGRPEFCFSKTVTSLRRCGYTGRIVLIVDNEDKAKTEYETLFEQESVVVFNKQVVFSNTDSGDNKKEKKAIVYARNACFDIAEKLGIDTFVQMDDDYTTFLYKKAGTKNKFVAKAIKSLDRIMIATCDFLNCSPSISAVAFAQGGDFVGGENSSLAKFWQIKRKCMNSWFCKTSHRLSFVGRLNEDASCYIVNGFRGGVFFQVPQISLNQVQTQAAPGGMTDAYLASGTYVKTMHSVMQAPSCVLVSRMGPISPRIHHRVLWDNTAPKIIPDNFSDEKKD